MKNKQNSPARGPGRPKYQPKFPRKAKWSFTDWEVANSINPENGKGPNCTTLTLRKNLAKDQARKGKSVIVRLKDEFAKPNSESGLGRKAYLFSLRSTPVTAVAPKTTRKTKTKGADVAVNVGSGTSDYEAQKAALLAPTPAVVIAPPSTPEPAPEVAPVAETPAPSPEAVAADTAAVSETAGVAA